MNSPDSTDRLPLPPHLVAARVVPGSSRMYTATDVLRGREVMLKWSRSRSETTALTREWLLLSRLLTGKFARPLEFRRIDTDQAYLTCDRIDGSTLAEVYPRLDARGRWEVVHAALEALDGLHRSGIVHGDIRPENLVVRASDQRVHLLDLEYTWSTHHLAAGMTYVAGWNPDLPHSGATQTPRSDLRALGELLASLTKDDRSADGWSKSLRTLVEQLSSDYDLELLAHAEDALVRLRDLTRSLELELPAWERLHRPAVAIERRHATARWETYVNRCADQPGTHGLSICGPPAIGKRTFVRVASSRHAVQGTVVQCLLDESPELLDAERFAVLREVLEDSAGLPLVVLPAQAPDRQGDVARSALPDGTCIVDVRDRPNTREDAADIWAFEPLTAREWMQWISASV